MKTSAKKATGKKVTKTAYVEGLPATLSAKEVVARGKSEGIKLSVAYVYGIRSRSKPAKKRGRAVGAASAPSKNAESELYRLIERIVEAKVQQVLTARFGALLQ